ncbi:MAG: hypothetical protein PHO20_05630 [Candidatus Peribacteraceae bacterium]|nr:hypothetical protein [Candidatus Peribacteraceae bacterium]MDD5740215.1 hypothetical protein [Candidatus Peribacteraceae bacterium]
MKQPMKVPEQPKENLMDQPKDAAPQQEVRPPRAEAPREQEMINARTNVVEQTRNALGDLARRLPKVEGVRQERFVA